MSSARAMIDRSYTDTTARLVDAHRRSDKGIVAIWSFPDPKEREVRLLEVTKSVPFNGDSLVPFAFESQSDIPFKSVVILAHPDEWPLVEAGKLKLPKGWDVASKTKQYALKKKV